MKIKISEAVRRAVKAHQAELQSALDVFLKANAAYAKALGRLVRLENEIAEGESGDDLSESAVNALTRKRTEFSMVRGQVERLAGAGSPAREQLLFLLREARNVIGSALRPAQAGYEAAVAEAFRPYYRAEFFGDGIQFARQTHAVQSLGAWVSFPYGADGEPSVRDANRALKVLEEILSGEISWEFKPQKIFNF